ncbi:MAG TPA: hemolysin III family protein, partial [Candidatus Limnocylindrales bacterium]|nr:hemolysin III family protein [Candidatus Limnocylindrales bacterium]
MRFRVPLREPVNGLTHLLGAALSIAGLVVLLVIAVKNGSTRQIVAFSIFGGSLVAMYCTSAFYHSLKVSPRAVAHLRRIDHMMIYILIAGSYTPICLVMLRGRVGIGLLIADAPTQH